MYSSTKIQIVEIIKKNDQIQVKDLVQELGITAAAVHRALKKLIEEGVLIKRGTPPLVFYFLNKIQEKQSTVTLSHDQEKKLIDHYLYINPIGEIEDGVSGFLSWMKNTQNKQDPVKCVHDYIDILNESESHRNPKYGLIEASDRFKNIFKTTSLDKVFYQDFYSLVKFGKTKLGQYLLNGKQSQNKLIIKKIALMIESQLKQLIKKEHIDAIAWAPHSIPRKIPFLKELEKNLNFNLPKIEIVKVYGGDIPIAQKSLSKLEERIQNARETMVVVPNKITAKKVLLIDDAVGSGATMNEIAIKIKAKGAKNVIGYAIVGSYKGFEVIKEV